MCRKVAYLLGFISFIECIEMKTGTTSIKLENEVTHISANLILNLLNMKIVSNISNYQNYQILNLQFSELEMNSILLETKPFMYKTFNKKIQLKYCNPQEANFKIMDIFDDAIFFQYAKITVDFRKNGRFKQ